MDRQAAEIGAVDLESLESVALADEIERRRQAHDLWVDVYSRDFIPLAHGIRLFGRFYNEELKPEDPYEFMGLLVSTPMLSLRRNQILGALAAQIRRDPELRRRLEAGEPVDERFEAALRDFEYEFGDAAFDSRKCFGDRTQLNRLLLSLADAPGNAEPYPEQNLEDRTRTFLEAVDSDRRSMAQEFLDLGRASYQLRDDDNIHLARLEALVLEAVEEGRRRLSVNHLGDLQEVELERVEKALRHPNLVVEPRTAEKETPPEEGFRARPRQLVGQPAGPGLATGPARVIEKAEDLFAFRAGEVLVCDAVDPNMTFVVPMAAAVVERRGGMLIHGAIIAREYGLPCVTGVAQVTTLLGTGDHLTVDGYLGIVTLSRE